MNDIFFRVYHSCTYLLQQGGSMVRVFMGVFCRYMEKCGWALRRNEIFIMFSVGIRVYIVVQVSIVTAYSLIPT